MNADAERMLATMQGKEISCSICIHMRGFIHAVPWFAIYNDMPRWGINQQSMSYALAEECPQFEMPHETNQG